MRTMICLLAGTACLTAIAEPIFEEDFEKGADRWMFTDDNAWKVVEEDDGNHALSLESSSDYSPKVRSPKSIAWVKDLTAGSFQLDIKMKQMGREYNHRDLCLFFGKQDAEHFYYVHIATAADPHAHSIFLVNNEPRVSIAKERTEGADWGKREYHHVRIVRNIETGTIDVYFDDMEKSIMHTVDKTFGTGGIGVGSFDDVGRYDDIKITALEAAE